MRSRLALRHPLICPRCGAKGSVVSTHQADGYVWRRHECRKSLCKFRWSSYQSLIPPYRCDPENIAPEHLLTK